MARSLLGHWQLTELSNVGPLSILGRSVVARWSVTYRSVICRYLDAICSWFSNQSVTGPSLDANLSSLVGHRTFAGLSLIGQLSVRRSQVCQQSYTCLSLVGHCSSLVSRLCFAGQSFVGHWSLSDLSLVGDWPVTGGSLGAALFVIGLGACCLMVGHL